MTFAQWSLTLSQTCRAKLLQRTWNRNNSLRLASTTSVGTYSTTTGRMDTRPTSSSAVGVVPPNERTNSRRYEYRRSRDTGRFNTDVIRRRVNRKPGRRCMTSRRRRRSRRSRRSRVRLLGRRLASSDLFPSLSTPAGNISLHESHFWPRSSIASAAERAGRHTPGRLVRGRSLGVPGGRWRFQARSSSPLERLNAA